MKREIKFRAKIKDRFPDGGKFWYWDLPDTFDNDYVNFLDWDTVGEYTGIKDINGVEIYEGDIVSADGMSNDVIIFKDGGFNLEGGEYSENLLYQLIYYGNYKVIGNIYDNPELLKEV